MVLDCDICVNFLTTFLIFIGFFIMPFVSLGIGFANMNVCTEFTASKLPTVLIVFGVISLTGLMMMILQFLIRAGKVKCTCAENEFFSIFSSAILMFGLVVCGAMGIIVGSFSIELTSKDPDDSDYCNKTLVYYTIFASVLYIVICISLFCQCISDELDSPTGEGSSGDRMQRVQMSVIITRTVAFFGVNSAEAEGVNVNV